MTYSQSGFRARFYSQDATNHASLDILETSPGNYLAGGISVVHSSNKWIYKLSLVGLNSVGAISWVKEYGNSKRSYPAYPFCYKTFCKQGQYIYYAGNAIDSAGKYFCALFKFDLNGNIVWQKDFRDAGNNLYIAKVAPSVDNGFLITGYVEKGTAAPLVILKTDFNGNELWRKLISKQYPDRSDGRAILQDSVSKKIVIGGTQYMSVDSVRDMIAVTDSMGNLLSMHSFTTGGCSDLIQTADKKILSVGWARSRSLFFEKEISFARKFDINSPELSYWSAYVGPDAFYNGFFAAEQLPGGDILIGGTMDSAKGEIYTNVLAKYVRLTQSGKVRNTRYYSYYFGTDLDNAPVVVSVHQTSEGGSIAAIRVYNNINNPLFFVKYDIDGCDSTTAYCKTVSVPEEGKKGIRVSIFPAITDGLIHVNMEVCDQPSEIKIFTAYGEQLSHLHCDARSTADIDLSSLSAGMYIVLVESGGEKWVKRVITIKS